MTPACGWSPPVESSPSPLSASPEPAGPARAVERLGWIIVALAFPALGLIKINPVDVPWHLATARLAEATGHWPVRNTFSWTYPDYTIYQQYPVFQATIYAVFKLAG